MNSSVTDSMLPSCASVASTASKSDDISCIESIIATARREALSIAIRDNDGNDTSTAFDHEILPTKTKLRCGPSKGSERLVLVPRRDSRRPTLERMDEKSTALGPPDATSAEGAEAPKPLERHPIPKITETIPPDSSKVDVLTEAPHNHDTPSLRRLLSLERRASRPGAFRISPSDQILSREASESTFRTTATDPRFRRATNESGCDELELALDAELVAYPVPEVAKVVVMEESDFQTGEPTKISFGRTQSRRSKYAIWVFLFTLISIILIVSLAIIFVGRVSPRPEGEELSVSPSLSPASLSEKWLIEQINDMLPLSSQAAMTDLESPQYKAVNWLQSDHQLPYYPMDRMLQRYALATFYFATAGPDKWGTSKFWLTDPDECNWFTTSEMPSICDPNGFISRLELTMNGLHGHLPEDVSLLASLEVLDVRSNSLEGGIPTSLFGMTSLSILDLGANVFSSELPKEIGRLTSLRFLSLFSNAFFGSIPTSLALLTNLEVLNGVNTALGGSFPVELASLTKLRVLAMGSTRLSHPLTKELAELENLEVVILDGNFISGTIPTEIANLGFLRSIDLSRNLLQGTVPSGLILAPNLMRLALANNGLSGTFPIDLTRTAGLEVIEIQGNRLHGTIPTEIGLMSNVKQLFLDGNDWSGTLPTEIGLITDLLDFSISGLSGKVPQEFCALRWVRCTSPGNPDFCSCHSNN